MAKLLVPAVFSGTFPLTVVFVQSEKHRLYLPESKLPERSMNCHVRFNVFMLSRIQNRQSHKFVPVLTTT